MRDDSSSLQSLPDSFVTQQQIDAWYDDYYDDDNQDKFFEWYEDYKKRKAQKTQIKKSVYAYYLPSIKILGFLYARG